MYFFSEKLYSFHWRRCFKWTFTHQAQNDLEININDPYTLFIFRTASTRSLWHVTARFDGARRPLSAVWDGQTTAYRSVTSQILNVIIIILFEVHHHVEQDSSIKIYSLWIMLLVSTQCFIRLNTSRLAGNILNYQNKFWTKYLYALCFYFLSMKGKLTEIVHGHLNEGGLKCKLCMQVVVCKSNRCWKTLNNIVKKTFAFNHHTLNI